VQPVSAKTTSILLLFLWAEPNYFHPPSYLINENNIGVIDVIARTNSKMILQVSSLTDGR
jgi:hypothetical protein